LTLNSTNGQLSGTPTAATASADYTITASNSGGSTTHSLELTVIDVDVLSGDIRRLVASQTSVAVDVSIRPVYFTFASPLYAKISDPAQVFQSAVSVTSNGDGSYTLALDTASDAPIEHHTDAVEIDLCRDAGCTDTQDVPSISIPFDIDVLNVGDWPGDNLLPLTAWAGVPDWSTFQGNAAHTGYVPVELHPDQFSTRWIAPSASIGGSYTPNMANIATAGDRFFNSGSNHVYARREHDGSELWNYDFSGLQFPSANPAAVSNGVVYVAAGQQSSTQLFAFAAADGSIVFRSPMSAQWEQYLAPTVGPEGVYTNAGTYGGLYAFNSLGHQLYFGSMAQTSLWTPAVDASGIYTYTGGYLKVLHPVTGAELESIQDATFQNYIYEIGGSPVLGAPNSVFVANYANSALNGGAIGNTLLHFNLETNAIDWQVPGVFPTTPAYHEGVLYVANENPLRLEARAEDDGELLWWWTPPHAADGGFGSEVLLTDTLLFVSTDRATYAIDLVSHKQVWSFPKSGRLALSRNGVLYIQAGSEIVTINVK
jgi:outer membrane protein assembly factor BamB